MSPIKAENKKRYPADWNKIRARILKRAKDRCEFCAAENGYPHPVTLSRVVLTIAHLDHTPENSDPSNLKALCQRCHNRYDREHRVANRKKTIQEKRRQLNLFEEQQ